MLPQVRLLSKCVHNKLNKHKDKGGGGLCLQFLSFNQASMYSFKEEDMGQKAAVSKNRLA